MQTKTFYRGVFVAAFLAIAAHAPAHAQDYFDNKKINMILGFAPGGPIDLAARTMAPYLKKHTPGNPTIIVQNMPGANTFTAHNHVFNAKGDGENIFYGSWFAVSQIVDDPAVRFKYQDFSIIGAGKSGGFLLLANPDIVPGGLTKSADIVKARKLHFPGQGPTNTFDLLGRMSLEVFKLPYNYTLGYRGVADTRQALTQKEGDIIVDSTTGFRSVDEDMLVKPGLAKVLWAIPDQDANGNYVRNDTIPEVPTIVEVYKEAFGKEPSGIEWDAFDLVIKINSVFTGFFAGPPNMDKRALEALRKGWSGMLQDPEFQADTQKRFGYVIKEVPLASASKVIDTLGHLKPELVAHLKKHIAEEAQEKKP